MNNARWLILIEETESVVGLLLPNGRLVLAEVKLWEEDEKKLLKNIQASQKECQSAIKDVSSPTEAVFVFSPFWINSQGELLQSRKELLKSVCQQTDLKPLGFLVGDEVFSQFFDDFVAVYLGQEHLRVTVVKNQEVKTRQELENGDQFEIKDVSILLKKIDSDIILPENLVFWGNLNKRAESELVDYDWQESGPFTEKPNLRILFWPETFKYISQLILKQGGGSSEPISEKVIEADEKDEDKEDLPFGFVNGDLAENQEAETKKEEQPSEPSTSQPEVEEEKEEEIKPKYKKQFSLKGVIPQFSLPQLPKFKSKRFLMFIPPLLVGLALILGASWYFSKLDLEVYVTAKEIEKVEEVVLNPEAEELEVESGVVPVDIVITELSGQATTTTSGEKLIGEKAKGEITIFNRTEERETFDAGTELIGPGELGFVLDDKVTVASKSADLTSGVDRWGEVKAKITAADIGAEYNLAADSVFTIGGYSRTEFLAKNENDLQGGTSRQVQAVDEEDQNKLRQQLKSDLEEKILAKLKNEIDNLRLIEGSIRTSIASESFSADVGEEKDELGLELKLEGQAVQLDEEKLKDLAQTVLSEEIEEGFILPSDSIEVEFNPDEESDQEAIKGELKMKGKLYPEIDKQEMGKAIAGKSKQTAKRIIRGYPRVYRFSDQLTPGIIGWWPFYPPQEGNITVRIKE